jgi:hypothetical protein
MVDIRLTDANCSLNMFLTMLLKVMSIHEINKFEYKTKYSITEYLSF